MMVLVKLFLFQSFILFVAAGDDVSIERKNCTSYNDPHIRGFSGYEYEFHHVGKYCMSKSKNYLVEARFEPCPNKPYATCNCGIRIDLANSNDFAELNYCTINFAKKDSDLPPTDDPPINSVTFPSGSFVCDEISDTQFDPLDESDWASVSVVPGSTFKCIHYFGYIWIKSELPNPNDNVFVQIDNNNLIDNMHIYFPDDIKSEGCGCLCDVDESNYKEFIANYPSDQGIKKLVQVLNEKECKNVLLGSLIESLERDNLLSYDLAAKIKQLIRYCAIDSTIIGETELGYFQKDTLRKEICLAALKSKEIVKHLGFEFTDHSDCVKRLSEY